MYVCERVGFASCGLQCGNGFFFAEMEEWMKEMNVLMKEWKFERTNGLMNTLVDKWKNEWNLLIYEWID